MFFSNTSRQKRSTRSNDRVSYKTSQALSGECCPSVTRPIAPLGGISKDGRLLQLFRDTHTIQKFYETECAPQVRDRPCAFIDENKWVSSCTQKYTYTYAIVKDFNVTEPYRIDYMMIKSGCSCTVMEPANQPKTELTDDIFKEDLLNELTADLFGEKK